jgi:hypothetical protein
MLVTLINSKGDRRKNPENLLVLAHPPDFLSHLLVHRRPRARASKAFKKSLEFFYFFFQSYDLQVAQQVDGQQRGYRGASRIRDSFFSGQVRMGRLLTHNRNPLPTCKRFIITNKNCHTF